jgi:hypothetical protein
MITLKEKASIETGAEVNYKAQELTVNYKHVLSTEVIDEVPTKVGKIQSWLFNETGNNIMGVERVDNDKDFVGKDILGELHKIYIAKLKTLNPKLVFTDTYNK